MKRYFRYGLSSLLGTVFFTAILVFIYLFSVRHDRVFDLTEMNLNTLDEKSMLTLLELKRPVELVLFDQNGPETIRVKDLLERYVQASSLISYEVVDPDVNPTRTQEAGVENYGELLVVSGERRLRLKSVTEESLTNALLSLGSDGSRVISFLSGHGEKPLADGGRGSLSQLKSLLEKDGHVVESLMLSGQEVGAATDLIVIAGPQKNLLEHELKSLRAYLDGGGDLLLALDPGADGGLRELLLDYGIQLGDDIIIDSFSRMLGGDYSTPVVNDYGAALKDFRYASFFPLARSLSILEGHSVEWLARTSRQSWAEHDLARWNSAGEAEIEDGDRPGPLNVALMAQAGSTLLVFGDADFMTDAYLYVSGNNDLIRSCINLLLEEELLVRIAAKESADKPFVLTPLQARLIFWFPVVFMPGLILLSGIYVLLYRRKV